MADVRFTTIRDDGGDLPCMRCGYNLRGLSGDPRRCPECGHANPLHELLLPADTIRRQLRRLESAPTWCFAGLLLGPLGGVIAVMLSSGKLIFPRSTWSVGFIPIVLAPIIWFLGASAFARSCLHCDGWRRALLHFHLYALGIFLAGHAALFGTWLLPLLSGIGVLPLAGGAVTGAVLAVMLWVLAIVLIRRLYRRLRGELVPLQRSVAVEMYLRERAAQRRSEWL